MHEAGAGSAHRPLTQRAGGMQAGPDVVLQLAPSAAAAVHVPGARSELHVPLAGQTAKLVAMTELAPHAPLASVSAMQRCEVVLHPTM
jgi:hypothetical protein